MGVAQRTGGRPTTVTAAVSTTVRTALLGLLGLHVLGCSNATTGPLDDLGIGGFDVQFGADFSAGQSDSGSGAADEGLSGDGTGPGNDSATASPDTSGTCEFASEPGPGEPGSACKTNDDCASGFCIDTWGGRVCTRSCGGCCPKGYGCEQFGSGDSVFVCVTQNTSECRPCNLDSECDAVSKGALCIDYGGAGRFCGGSCETADDCPDGFACKATFGSSGSGTRCVRADQQCSCSPQAVEAKLGTTCKVSNGFGTCSGTRSCTAEGLSACSASTPAAEVCNGQDDDCNGKTDEGAAGSCTTYFADNDGDGQGKAGSEGQCLCQSTDLYKAVTAGDCNDDNASIYAGAKELCNDVDDDCDGVTDNDCDKDADGWCDAAKVVVGTPASCPQGKGDCADDNAALHPGQADVCGDGLDNDCSGEADTGEGGEGCLVFYQDLDQDQFGGPASKCLCAPAGNYSAAKSKDCNDGDPAIHPGQSELCGNGIDDNCNLVFDEEDASGCSNFFSDGDGDGFGTGSPLCLCVALPSYPTKKSGDCNDKNPQVSPGGAEVCNGVDDDCDGLVDEQDAQGCTNYYVDGDGDGFGPANMKACLCEPSNGFVVAAAGDCDDTDPQRNPGQSEACNGIDDNCNGKLDDQNATGCQLWFKDADKDLFGDPTSGLCLCGAEGAWVTQQPGDCDDTAPAANPGIQEACNGKDDNCNGKVDEANATGCAPWAADADGDGFGANGSTTCLCAPDAVYQAKQEGDCDDGDNTVKPGGAEVCNGKDDNCDGVVDNGGAGGQCTVFYQDLDGDGFGTGGGQCQCAPGNGFVAAVKGDCDDGDAAVNPKAAEVCNGKDDNCDATVDGANLPLCKNFYLDADNDGWGKPNVSLCLCAGSGLYTSQQSGDCDDGAPLVNPGAPEQCNGKDDNCNGQVDDNPGNGSKFYFDGDGDGWGVGNPVTLCAPSGSTTATKPGDCDDGDKSVNPGATEIQCNGKDDDCNAGEQCTCNPAKEDFENGTNGWALGGGWGVAGWCKNGGGSGLGFGNGSNYGAVTGQSSATKGLNIPPGATKMTFWYRYSPDPGEYGSFDEFNISFGGTQLVSVTAGSKGNTSWQQVVFNLPGGWAGTSKSFNVWFHCKDSVLNSGWGAAVDDIQFVCN